MHAGELVLELLLGRIHHHLGPLAEQKFLHLQEAIQITLEDLTHVDFVDLALIEENNPVDLTAFRHDRGYNQELKGRAV